jgi:hypothetical protein
MSSTCLHITNGDATVDVLKASLVSGDILPWRDTMHKGPFPHGLDLDQVSKIRAQYFSGSDMLFDDVMRDFSSRNTKLRTAPQYEKIILWFEHDLVDQLQLLQILDWFHFNDFDLEKLSIICLDRFKGVDNFRGLGELSPQQISTLLPTALPVTAQHLKLARDGWQAFRSPDPHELLSFLNRSLDVLPFLKAALVRHMQEYPWVINGLTRMERQLLKLVGSGVCEPQKLFQQSMALETVYFMGDWTVFSQVATLCSGKTPLISTKSSGAFIHPRDVTGGLNKFAEQRLQLTASGRQVLSGEINTSSVIDRDTYLGGVHIKSGQPMWMWDDQLQICTLSH